MYIYFHQSRQRPKGRGKDPKMSKYRRTRINDEVTRVVAEAIRTVKDPRVADSIVTITKADVSGDLKFAKIYFSAFGADHEEAKQITKGLYSAQGYLRSYIARELNLRITPELSFEYDNAMEHGQDIMRLLKKIEKTETSLPAEEEAEEETDE